MAASGYYAFSRLILGSIGTPLDHLSVKGLLYDFEKKTKFIALKDIILSKKKNKQTNKNTEVFLSFFSVILVSFKGSTLKS